MKTKHTYLLLIPIFMTLFSSNPLAAEEEEEFQLETSFTRDVMMPIGLPVVSSFHAIRESIFLNTETKNGTPLESIGDFFLIPSRYLFNGKTIEVENLDQEKFRESLSFSYDNLHWFKTLVSLIALAPSEVLGAAFKGLAYLSPEVRNRHQMLKKALKSTLCASHLETYRQQGVEAFHSDEFIPCQNHKRPSGPRKNQKIEIEALREIGALLDKHNIIWWIDCGTCLGAYRYGGIIPWDWDVDISILMPDHDNVKKLLSNLDPEKYEIQDWSSYSKPKSFLKLFVKKTNNFLDIYHYQLHENEKSMAFFYSYFESPFPYSWKKEEIKCMTPLQYSDVFPLKKAAFDGLTVWAPNNVITFLQSKYGPNLDPAKVWDEVAKTYVKVEGHPYYDE